MKGECEGGRPRDYVDEITLHVDADTAGRCAEKIRVQLGRLKAALNRDGMVRNDGKQQVLGLPAEVRSAWEQLGGCSNPRGEGSWV